jgi:phage-related protein
VSKVVYYISPSGENPVKKFLESLQKNQKAKIFRIFGNIEQYGLIGILPHIRKINGPLWEIRILGKDNIRVLYAAVKEDKVLVLDGFVKKRQKTPVKEIDIAISRLKDWQTRN